ncbi:hypothetical protein [Haloferula sp. A504]|uniref:hypothetical protein n=1 Tax=Haloferula sp. A504 TaxID=3373601 RepID=UPI0031C604CE|nr:hypothetical protein [Verrucomicrobiaceae bacterium E54]
MKRFGFHALKLVYPPITNQEGEWLYKVPEVRDILRSSKLYVLGQREELLFDECSVDEETRVLAFNLKCGGIQVGPVSLALDQFDLPDTFQVEIGPRCFKVRKSPINPEEEPIYWCTPNTLLTEWFNDLVELNGIESPWELMRFRMHYVGISKENDSFQRLFGTGHKARTSILTNERQITPEARVSDELVLFMFQVEPSTFETCITEEDIESMWLEPGQFPDQQTYAADAEKALVNIMDSKYNEKKYPNYPKGIDGLYGKGLDRYGFHFEELVEFVTDKCSIRGGKPFGDEEPDLILVEGDEVELVSVSQMKANSEQPPTSEDPPA